MKSKKQAHGKAEQPETEPGREPASFEESFAVVEGAVEHLERGNLSLAESLGEYERGLAALKQCYAILERAQKRIEVLGEEVGAVAEGTSGLYWKPASSHPALGQGVDPLDLAEESVEEAK